MASGSSVAGGFGDGLVGRDRADLKLDEVGGRGLRDGEPFIGEGGQLVAGQRDELEDEFLHRHRGIGEPGGEDGAFFGGGFLGGLDRCGLRGGHLALGGRLGLLRDGDPGESGEEDHQRCGEEQSEAQDEEHGAGLLFRGRASSSNPAGGLQPVGVAARKRDAARPAWRPVARQAVIR